MPRSTRGPSLGSEAVTAAEAFARARPLLDIRPSLLASDFDGTLSHFVPDPWSATILPVAQRALRRLAVAPDVHVALVSGRTVSDLAGRARVGGISYRGDHGAQVAEAPRGFRPRALLVSHEDADPSMVRMAAALKAAISAAIPESWLVLEDKGAALTFHFRSAPDLAGAQSRVMAAVDATDTGRLLVRSVSPRAVELRPPMASTKGDALRALIEARRCRSVLMIGDDRNDALAFDVLRELRDAGQLDGLAMAVAGRADLAAEVAPRADLVLSGPDDTARLLGMLARATTGGT